MTLENVEITISYQEWPKAKIILKHGLSVQTGEAHFDQVVEKFGAMWKQFLTESVERQLTRRKQHGS